VHRIHIPAGVRAHSRSRVIAREDSDPISGMKARLHSFRNRCLRIRDWMRLT
jgi:hypothetical protein